MKDLRGMARDFQELENAIERLKRAERELEGLQPLEDVFNPQIESITAKLKLPDKVEEVEQELSVLRRQMKERRLLPKQAAEPLQGYGATADLPAGYPTSPFPRELENLYYDVSFIGSGGLAKVFRAKRRGDGTEVAVKVPLNLDALTGKSFVREIISWQHLSHINIVRFYDFNILPIPYLEMELCQGSLNELHKPLDVRRAVSMTFQVAEGLKHANSQSIIHLGAILYELVIGQLPFEGDTIVELLAQIVNEPPTPTSVLNPQAVR